MSHHVKVMAQRLCTANLVVEISSWLVTALDNRAQSVAYPRMAGGAIYVEALLALLQDGESCREGQLITLFAVSVRPGDRTGVEIAVFLQLPARYSIFNLWPGRAMVGKEIRAPLRDELGLVMHILPASDSEHASRSQREKDSLSGA